MSSDKPHKNIWHKIYHFKVFNSVDFFSKYLKMELLGHMVILHLIS